LKKLIYKPYHKLISYVSITAIVLSASGCIKLGPDYVRPNPDIVIPESYQHRQAKPEKDLLKDRWWEAFGDPELNKLVQNVLKNNLDIKKAAVMVLEFKSQFVKTKADRFPALGIRGDVNRQHKIVSLLTGGSRFKTIDTYNLSLPASFEIDIFVYQLSFHFMETLRTNPVRHRY
jgi:multidrug efflux system outer membrane protein